MNKRIYVIATVLSIGFVSCEDILEVPDISEQTVTLLAPSDGTVLDADALTLNWEPLKQAEGYNIQVATPNFESAAQLVLDSIVKMDTLENVTTHIDQNLGNGIYEWRVKAFNSGFETPYTLSGFQVIADENVDATLLKKTKPSTLIKEDEASGAYNLTINN